MKFKVPIIEMSILLASLIGSLKSNIDIIIRFIVPLLSYIAWFLLKPVLIKWRIKLLRRIKKHNDDQTDNKST